MLQFIINIDHQKCNLKLLVNIYIYIYIYIYNAPPIVLNLMIILFLIIYTHIFRKTGSQANADFIKWHI